MQIIADETTGIRDALQLDPVQIPPLLGPCDQPTSSSGQQGSWNFLHREFVLALSDNSVGNPNITKVGRFQSSNPSGKSRSGKSRTVRRPRKCSFDDIPVHEEDELI